MPVPASVQVGQWSPTAGGPAALATLLQTYGRPLSPAQLEQLAEAKGKKASLTSLDKAARSVRFKTRVVKSDFPGLSATQLPAIAEWKDGEFRLFISTEGDRVEVLDPLSGERTWPRAAEIACCWTGRLLLAQPSTL